MESNLANDLRGSMTELPKRERDRAPRKKKEVTVSVILLQPGESIWLEQPGIGNLSIVEGLHFYFLNKAD